MQWYDTLSNILYSDSEVFFYHSGSGSANQYTKRLFCIVEMEMKLNWTWIETESGSRWQLLLTYSYTTGDPGANYNVSRPKQWPSETREWCNTRKWKLSQVTKPTDYYFPPGSSKQFLYLYNSQLGYRL